MLLYGMILVRYLILLTGLVLAFWKRRALLDLYTGLKNREE